MPQKQIPKNYGGVAVFLTFSPLHYMYTKMVSEEIQLIPQKDKPSYFWNKVMK